MTSIVCFDTTVRLEWIRREPVIHLGTASMAHMSMKTTCGEKPHG